MSHDSKPRAIFEENVCSPTESAISKETRSVPGRGASKRLRAEALALENFLCMKRNTERKQKWETNNIFGNIHICEYTDTLDIVEHVEMSDMSVLQTKDRPKKLRRMTDYLSKMISCTPQPVERSEINRGNSKHLLSPCVSLLDPL